MERTAALNQRSMIDSDEDETNIVPIGAPLHDAGELPYKVELWTMTRDKVERMLGEAASAMLAQAIFNAAKSEYLGRRIVLRRGSKVIAATD